MESSIKGIIMKTIKNIFLSGALLCMAMTSIHGMESQQKSLGALERALGALQEALPDGQLEVQRALGALQEAMVETTVEAILGARAAALARREAQLEVQLESLLEAIEAQNQDRAALEAQLAALGVQPKARTQALRAALATQQAALAAIQVAGIQVLQEELENL